MHQNWKTQNIVVTGAASGLGRALCARFADLEANVRGIDINKSQLDQMDALLGENFLPVICDVASWEEVVDIFEQFPPIDVLVNSAGITGQTNLKSEETDPADVQRVFRINFFGSYHTSKAVLPQMVKRRYGRLLHIASIAGKEGNAGMLAYSASKAAVIGMTKVQGKEVAGTGVTVNALAPAVIQTPMVAALPAQQVKYMTDKIPMGRCCTLDELVAMVEFIVSPSCGFTTGFTFDLQAAEPRTEKIVSASCQYQWESRKNCDATPLTENWQLTLTTAYVVLMPYLSIHTNSAMPEQAQSALLDAASKIVSSQLGKPEDSVMASFVPAARMRFAGEESPTAFLELSSIGIPDSKRNPLVSALTDLVARSCQINTDRIFVVLADVKAPFWSSNGATIG